MSYVIAWPRRSYESYSMIHTVSYCALFFTSIQIQGYGDNIAIIYSIIKPCNLRCEFLYLISMNSESKSNVRLDIFAHDRFIFEEFLDFISCMQSERHILSSQFFSKALSFFSAKFWRTNNLLCPRVVNTLDNGRNWSDPFSQVSCIDFCIQLKTFHSNSNNSQ